MGNCCGCSSRQPKLRTINGKTYAQLQDKNYFSQLITHVDIVLIKSNAIQQIAGLLTNAGDSFNSEFILRIHPESFGSSSELEDHYQDLMTILCNRLTKHLSSLPVVKDATLIISKKKIHVNIPPSLSSLPLIKKEFEIGVGVIFTLSLFVRIIRGLIKEKVPHQYNSDIIYQTEASNYYRIMECLICYEQMADVLYLGCMHIQVCHKCQMNKRDPNYDQDCEGRRNCPVCGIWSGVKDRDWRILEQEELNTQYPICLNP
jgi:hypothetical protein